MSLRILLIVRKGRGWYGNVSDSTCCDRDLRRWLAAQLAVTWQSELV
jgi:hypothetical protein